VGAAVQISHRLPAGFGRALEDLAKQAFVHATSEALLVGAAVVFVASALVARYMPATSPAAEHAHAPATSVDRPTPARSEA
jgi:hypothetical protein